MTTGIPAQSSIVRPCCMLALAPCGVCAIIVGRQKTTPDGGNVGQSGGSDSFCRDYYCLQYIKLEDVMQHAFRFDVPICKNRGEL